MAQSLFFQNGRSLKTRESLWDTKCLNQYSNRCAISVLSRPVSTCIYLYPPVFPQVRYTDCKIEIVRWTSFIHSFVWELLWDISHFEIFILNIYWISAFRMGSVQVLYVSENLPSCYRGFSPPGSVEADPQKISYHIFFRLQWQNLFFYDSQCKFIQGSVWSSTANLTKSPTANHIWTCHIWAATVGQNSF